MSKVNFTKAEQALAAGLLKMSVDRLLFLADVASSFGGSKNNSHVSPSRKEEFQDQLRELKEELKRLSKTNPSFYEDLGVSRDEIKSLFNSIQTSTQEGRKKIRILKTKIKQYRKEKMKDSKDQELIQSQRKKQVSKRFNVNEKWLPMR